MEQVQVTKLSGRRPQAFGPIVLVGLLLMSVLTNCDWLSTQRERLIAAIEAEGLTEDSIVGGTLSFVQAVAEDPEGVVTDLALGAVNVLNVALDPDLSFEHKAEVLGPFLVPFWSCVRPALGDELFKLGDEDLSQFDFPDCVEETLLNLLTRSAGHLLGRAAQKIGDRPSFNLNIDSDDAKRLVRQSRGVYDFTSTLYQEGVSRTLPLALQTDRLARFSDYERFAHPAFFTGTTIEPGQFDLEEFLQRTGDFQTADFDRDRSRLLFERVTRDSEPETVQPEAPPVPAGFNSCSAQGSPDPAAGYTINSNGDGFLSIREEPTSASDKLGSFDEGTTNVSFDQCAQTNPDDRWWHLQGGQGWMSARWISGPS